MDASHQGMAPFCPMRYAWGNSTGMGPTLSELLEAGWQELGCAGGCRGVPWRECCGTCGTVAVGACKGTARVHAVVLLDRTVWCPGGEQANPWVSRAVGRK